MPGGGSSNDGPTARDVEQELRSRVDTLVPDLLTGAMRDGAFWCAGSINGEAGQSLKVNRQGPRRGLWTDFSAADGTDERGGDMLQLICAVRFGGWSRGDEARSKAIQWGKSFLGWESLDRDKLQTVRRDADARALVAAEVAAKEIEDKRKRAFALWCGSVPIEGTPAEAYLRGRGIDFGKLGRIPGSLRYMPDCWCPTRRGKHPAMIASIYAGSEFQAVHRTFLDVSQGKRGPVKVVKVAADRETRKIRLARPGDARPKSHKLTLGQYLGGCIVLWKGGRSGSLADMPQGTPVYVSEGIEDGLSVAVADPKLTVVAGVALANMGSLKLPPHAGPLVFIGQNDPIDSKAVEAFERAVARQQLAAREAGRDKPRLFHPPEGFKDFNDYLLGKAMT